jgi:hypothetical protein
MLLSIYWARKRTLSITNSNYEYLIPPNRAASWGLNPSLIFPSMHYTELPHAVPECTGIQA